MARSRKKKKTTNPVYYFFCEGQTEKVYIQNLNREKQKNISVKIEKRNSIIEATLNSYFKQGILDETKDKIFLVYDLDVDGMLAKLQAIENRKPNTELLTSNPCFELWYLLHFQNQTANINSENCEHNLKKYLPNYKKGEEQNFTDEEINNAINRARKLKHYENPHSLIYKLWDYFKKIK